MQDITVDIYELQNDELVGARDGVDGYLDLVRERDSRSHWERERGRARESTDRSRVYESSLFSTVGHG